MTGSLVTGLGPDWPFAGHACAADQGGVERRRHDRIAMIGRREGGGWGPIAAGAASWSSPGRQRWCSRPGATSDDPSRVNAGNSRRARRSRPTGNPVAVTVGTTRRLDTVASTTTIAIPTTVETQAPPPSRRHRSPLRRSSWPPPLTWTSGSTGPKASSPSATAAASRSIGPRSSDNALVAATTGGSLGPGEQTDVTISVSRRRPDRGRVRGDRLGPRCRPRDPHQRALAGRTSAGAPRDGRPAGPGRRQHLPRNTPALTGVVAAAVIDESPVA